MLRPTGRIEVEHGAEIGQAAVVHVGRREGDVAQGRRPEPAAVAGLAGEVVQTLVFRGIGVFAADVVEPGVVECVVEDRNAFVGARLGEVETAVAMVALESFREEVLQSVDRRRFERVVLSRVGVGVEWRPEGDQRTDETRECIDDVGELEGFAVPGNAS